MSDAAEGATFSPQFALSVPIQLTVMSIVLATTVVMFLNLVFTATYHYPLSRLNLLLQLVSTLVFAANVAAYLGCALHKLHNVGHEWPFVFPYMAAPLPPRGDGWSAVEMAFFAILQAVTRLSAHATYIQFLTLLFPSALEVRLIFWMLGPLALVQAGMVFTQLTEESNVKVIDLGDAINNICESTLALLYMVGLLVWGVVVNWRRAWHLDGAAAAFGSAAIFLAVGKTAISFVQVVYDRVYWLYLFSCSMTLWQSWLGFWWWVSAGMGIGEVEDRARRDERTRQRQARRQRRAQHKTAAARPEGAPPQASSSSSAMERFLTRVQRTRSSVAHGDVELVPMPPPAARSSLSSPVENSSAAESQQTTMNTSETLPWLVRAGRTIERYQPGPVRRRIERLSLAHRRAAQDAAARQVSAYNYVLSKTQLPLSAGVRGRQSAGAGATDRLGGARTVGDADADGVCGKRGGDASDGAGPAEGVRAGRDASAGWGHGDAGDRAAGDSAPQEAGERERARRTEPEARGGSPCAERGQSASSAEHFPAGPRASHSPVPRDRDPWVDESPTPPISRSELRPSLATFRLRDRTQY
ncbi:hypothetical protein MSPP1_003987 [Malassezia sp. CBS 17886]|nr:hypothetical protein MSPP1_003987 [Malassezia sp. CBS 17886]